jgi:uncharacterized protein
MLDSASPPAGKFFSLPPNQHMRFIADRTLGKLARKLRTLGFDAVYWRGGNPGGAAEAARAEGRLLLTRSRKILEKPPGLDLLIVEANDPRDQLREVLARLSLKAEEKNFFRRCLLCNEELRPLEREEAAGRVPDFILQLYGVFHGCPRCRRVYWPGTHYAKMKKELGDIAGKME